MEFGKVSNVDLVNFVLPPDDPATQQLWRLLTEQAADVPLRFFLGGTQWGRTDWVGKVYPKGTKQKDFLAQYVRQFNCVELNTLFYSLQPREVIERWAATSDSTFRFCPKFPEVISHRLQLKNAGRETEAFTTLLSGFAERLGPSFLQLPETFGPDRLDVLLDYISGLPEGFRACVELRHPAWFTGRPAVMERLSGFLLERGVGLVITDTAGRRDVLHMRLTAPFVFIRWAGNNGHPTDFQRLDDWAVRIKEWIEKGLRSVYFIIHNPDEHIAPDLAQYAIQRMNEVCGAGLKPLKLFNPLEGQNLSLF